MSTVTLRSANVYVRFAILFLLICLAVLFIAAAIMARNYGVPDDDGDAASVPSYLKSNATLSKTSA